jgi:Ca2+-binding RTX toxin-like protein
LLGGPGNDRIFGRGGSDQFFGDDPADPGVSGDDSIDGGEGNDIITGGPGRDTLTGGAGSDSFVFAASTDGIDVITDFTIGEDQLVLSSSGFGGTLTIASQIIDAEFISYDTIAMIMDADDDLIDNTNRILYIESTGNLYFTPQGLDMDGLLPTSATQIATIFSTFGGATPMITEADIQVIA